MTRLNKLLKNGLVLLQKLFNRGRRSGSRGSSFTRIKKHKGAKTDINAKVTLPRGFKKQEGPKFVGDDPEPRLVKLIKRRLSRILTRKIVPAALVLIILIFGLLILRSLGIFSIQSVDISYNNSKSAKYTNVKDYMIKSELYGQSYFTINVEEISRDIEQNYPSVKYVISEKVFPNKVTIKIIERVPKLSLNINNSLCVIIDEDQMTINSIKFEKVVDSNDEQEEADIEVEDVFNENNIYSQELETYLDADNVQDDIVAEEELEEPNDDTTSGTGMESPVIIQEISEGDENLTDQNQYLLNYDFDKKMQVVEATGFYPSAFDNFTGCVDAADFYGTQYVILRDSNLVYTTGKKNNNYFTSQIFKITETFEKYNIEITKFTVYNEIAAIEDTQQTAYLIALSGDVDLQLKRMEIIQEYFITSTQRYGIIDLRYKRPVLSN